MKIKALVLTLLIFNIFLIAGNVYSQKNDKVQKTPEEIAVKVSDRMKKKLSLSDDQYKQVYSLVLTNAQERINNKEKYKSMDKVSRKDLKKQNRESFKLQIQSILTKEQIDKMNQLKEKRKNKKGKEKNKDTNK